MGTPFPFHLHVYLYSFFSRYTFFFFKRRYPSSLFQLFPIYLGIVYTCPYIPSVETSTGSFYRIISTSHYTSICHKENCTFSLQDYHLPCLKTIFLLTLKLIYLRDFNFQFLDFPWTLEYILFRLASESLLLHQTPWSPKSTYVLKSI